MTWAEVNCSCKIGDDTGEFKKIDNKKTEIENIEIALSLKNLILEFV